MLALFPATRWPAVTILLLALVALMIVCIFLAGQAVEDVGSWRWSSGRPV
jgi:hypothetical protein